MKIIKWTFITIGLIVFNVFIVSECLLRVGGLFENICKSRLEIELQNADSIYDFSDNMRIRLVELGLKNRFKLNYLEKAYIIPYSTVEKYNPYPPILHYYDSAYVVYKKNYEIKQVTILSGESDTTPSILVNKIRREETGWGDRFTTYIFYQNNILSDALVIDYDRIDWYSWRGGSYDGFEELWFFPLTIVELILLISIIWIRKRSINRK